MLFIKTMRYFNQTEKIKKNMKKELEKLNENLKEFRSELYSELNDGLTESEIEVYEKKLNTKFPEDLKEIYIWKNGQNIDCYDSFVNNSTFISLERSLEIVKEHLELNESELNVLNWWNKSWIPIFDNGGGDFICYDLEGTFTSQKGQLVEFCHEEKYRNVISPNLEKFISKLNKFYKENEEDEIDEDSEIEIENVKGYPIKFDI